MSSRLLRRGLPAVLVFAALALSSCRYPPGQWADLAMPPPIPPGAGQVLWAHPNPPACAPSGFCLLTGTATSSDIDEPYALGWANGRWSTRPVPPYGASVSCASATTCAIANARAVGVFDGSRWVSTPTEALFPDAPVARYVVVSCGAPDRCVALSTDRAASWDGTTWTPSANTIYGAYLVACVGPSFCLAGGQNGATYRFDGTTWAPAPPLSSAEGYKRIDALACWAVDACLLAGVREVPDPGGDDHGELASESISARWDGHTFQPAEVPPGVKALGCVAADRCVGLGTVNTAYIRDGGGWQRSAVPVNEESTFEHTGVSCAVNWCLVSGDERVGDTSKAVAQRWTFRAR